MTLRFRFSKSDMITTAGVAMRPIEITDAGGTFERVGQPGITEAFSHQELAEMMRRPDTTYFAGYFDRAAQEMRLKKPVDLISELPEQIRRLVIWRKAVCDAFLALEATGDIRRTQEGYDHARPRLAAETQRRVGEGAAAPKKVRPGKDVIVRNLPGSRTAFQWVRSYQSASCSPLALIPETYRSGNRERFWCPRSEALMNQVVEIYADTQRPTKVQAIKETQARFDEENRRRAERGAPPLVVPSAASIRRRLSMADPFYLYAKRYGAAAAAKHFTLFSNGPDVVRPMERVEMDENLLDVISLLTLTGIWDHLPRERQKKFESGRRWLYIAIDCATKCVLSMRLADNPNSDDAIRALRQIFEDKTPLAQAAECESTWHHHGGIGTLVTDMGSAFTSDAFQGTVASLGTTAHLPSAGVPWLRGHIESFFRTLGHQLMPLLAGRTFFDTVERGDYPSETLACLCDDDLIKILLTFIVDIYHNQPHGSLKGETPNAAWERLVVEHGTPLVPDGLTLRKEFGRPMVRKLRGDGVLFAGLSYSCEALREAYLHSPTRQAEIRADLSDIGWVAVRVGATWYPALANQPGFDGITFEQLREGRRSIRQKHKRDALLDAPKVQRAIQRISEINRRAFALRELTPFHMTDIDVARSEAALHYPIRSDSMRLGHIKPSDDPLSNGISITAPIGKGKLDAPSNDTTNPPERRERRERRKHWRFDDEK
ncbi:Integrase core domain-containing protein [Celeribacter baekdonensis]|uniref:Integrase core domain-containing protein n=1 Tax=Celeribacter baekdonensis TaxID=875171 RepID=A0A1G7U6S4_9RHOB|nr:DDE-type integrase/transposase/recombinase [Celeribacter baekdonensis]SDG43114.1 Integrase core domain-containing protein [Celeribacter baekdonensis]